MNIYRKTIYDVFRTKTGGNKSSLLNKILKGTKSILANRNGYQSYIKNYFLSTKYSTFKAPDITEYPRLKENSSFLIPLNTLKFKEKEKTPVFKRQHILLETDIFHKNKNTFLEDFNKRLINEQRKNKKSFSYSNINKKRERYNSLFLDFFSKWKSNNKKINLKYALAQEKKPDEIKQKKTKSFYKF